MSFYFLDGTHNPFPNYNFTGTMRPVYPLSVTRKVPDHIPRPDYAQDGQQPVQMLRAQGLNVEPHYSRSPDVRS